MCKKLRFSTSDNLLMILNHAWIIIQQILGYTNGEYSIKLCT